MGTVVQLHSLPSASRPVGHRNPRVSTPPLRELTPETSFGFAVIAFARDVLEAPLDPWQESLMIRAGELLPDGRPRFRQVLVLVARQNGKTHLCAVLAAYWMAVQVVGMVLGMSTNISYAEESWEKVVQMFQDIPELNDLLGKARYGSAVKRAAGKEELRTKEGSRYKIAASNSKGGRSLTVDRIIMDELREQRDWSAYNAAIPTMNARPFGQAWFITNQGDDTAVVLDSLHKAASRYINTGEGDSRLGLFEWSAPDGADLMDEEAWAAANPNLGVRIDHDTLHSLAIRARDGGGAEEGGFRTEYLCQRVKNLDAAINPAEWAACAKVFEMPKDRRVGVVDVSADMRRATLSMARITPLGRVQVALVKDWDGPDALKRLRAELPGLVKTAGLRQLGYLPIGPAAAIVPAMQKNRQVRWPAGMEIVAITGEVAALCMGFAEQVAAGDVEHLSQPLLNAQVESIAKKWNMGRWIFARGANGEGHCDAAYAAAGAVHLARMLPAPVRVMNLVGPDDDD